MRPLLFFFCLCAVLFVACRKTSAEPVPQRPPDDAPGIGDCRNSDDCELVTLPSCCACCPSSTTVGARKKGASMPSPKCPQPSCDCTSPPSCAPAARVEDFATECTRGACFVHPKAR